MHTLIQYFENEAIILGIFLTKDVICILLWTINFQKGNPVKKLCIYVVIMTLILHPQLTESMFFFLVGFFPPENKYLL